MLFSAMLTDAFTGEDVGIELRSRTDGGFYKPQRLKADTKVMLDMLRDLLFADDCALCASSEREMQPEVVSQRRDKWYVAGQKTRHEGSPSRMERRKPSAAGSPFCLPAQAQARATHPARRKNAREAGQLNALREQLRGSHSGAGLRRLVQPPACPHPHVFSLPWLPALTS